jgi:hypothetical protein
MGFDRLEDLLSQVVLLQQVPECQDRRLIRDPIVDLVENSQTAHGGQLD